MIWGKESIGERVRRLRLDRGLTQEDLAHKTELSEETINRIETGVTRVLGEFRERIAAALDVSEEYLQNGDSPAERETMHLIAEDRERLAISQTEEPRLKQMASEAIKYRNNARVPLSRLEVEALLMVLRGGRGG